MYMYTYTGLFWILLFSTRTVFHFDTAAAMLGTKNNVDDYGFVKNDSLKLRNAIQCPCATLHDKNSNLLLVMIIN